MSASITQITNNGAGAWTFTWTGTSPYRVYYQGVPVYANTTTDTSKQFITDDAIEPPFVEVIDSTQTTADVQQILYPPFMTLQWRGATEAEYYIVQRVTTAGGNTIYENFVTIRETGQGYYVCNTPVLDDVTTHTWRVAAVDAVGNEADLDYQFFMVRNPDAPKTALTYAQGTTTFTLAAS